MKRLIEQSEVKLPGRLQVDDLFWTLEKDYVDEHKMRKNYKSDKDDSSALPFYRLKEHVVEGIITVPHNKTFVMINDKFTAPKMGYNDVYPETAVISDKKVADDLFISYNLSSYDEAMKLVKEAEKRLDFIKDALATIDPSLDCLNNRSKTIYVAKSMRDLDNPDENERSGHLSEEDI
jgi:hypothetical protein